MAVGDLIQVLSFCKENATQYDVFTRKIMIIKIFKFKRTHRG